MVARHLLICLLAAGCTVRPDSNRTPGRSSGGGQGNQGADAVDGDDGDDGAGAGQGDGGAVEGEGEGADGGEGEGEDPGGDAGDGGDGGDGGEGEGEGGDDGPGDTGGGGGEGEGEVDPGCAEALTACGEGCVDLTSDHEHCGECFQRCAGGFECADSTCLEICGRDEVRCDRDCAVLATSAEHCGVCGHACGGISNAARQAGYGDATSTNSFGFHSCGGSCQRVMCRGDHCNSALSYIDLNKPHGYTLCRVAWCDNGEQDAERGETGPDCGGDECERRCAVGQGCEDGTDCASGICDDDGLCVAPNCEDGIWNGNEEGVDRNGDCDAVCPTCVDDERNGLETDTDCGGPDCDPCDDGADCQEAADCVSGVCEGDECQRPTCDDGVRNGGEPVTDCGTPECGDCPNQFEVLEREEITFNDVDFLALKVRPRGERSSLDNWCFEYEDLCQSFGDQYRPTGCGGQWRDRGGYGVCFSEYGSYADDEVLGCNPSGPISQAARQAGWNDANGQNSFGFHSCGGSCQRIMCRGDNCNSALSYIDMSKPHGYTLCRIAHCEDGEQGQLETDVDCGGPRCAPCGDGQGCEEPDDCEDGVCEDGACARPTCEDGVANGGEEDIDCGGPCVAVCPTCVDRERNGEEADVDCGGPDCDPCPDGGGCGEGGDCESGVCDDGRCQEPTCDDGVRNGGEPLVDCGNAECGECPNQFEVLEEREIVYREIPYLALRVRMRGATSSTENWCREYQELCAEYDRRPTGCGVAFEGRGGYGVCMDEYDSFVTDDSLGCNPSNGVRTAATQAGFEGATSQNSFGFHSCGGTCQREMCAGDHCHTALSYIDITKEFGFTLCR